MKITKRQLRRIIKEERARSQRINEGVWEYVKDFVDPSGWIFSGAGAGIDEDELKKIASPDAWILFKAMGGLGTDEDAIENVLRRRRSVPGDLQKLNGEFNELRKNLVGMRGGVKANVLQGILGAIGSGLGSGYVKDKVRDITHKTQTGEELGWRSSTSSGTKWAGRGAGAATQLGINKVMHAMQDRDLAAWLRSDGMDAAASEIERSMSTEGRLPSNEGRRRIIVSLSQIRKVIKEHLTEIDETPATESPITSKEAEDKGYADGKAGKEDMKLKNNPHYKRGHRKGQNDKADISESYFW